jgi:hypothetical protein
MPAGTKKQGLISKITRVKSAGGVAQIVEFQYSKCKALSSNTSITSPTHPKKGKRKEEGKLR